MDVKTEVKQGFPKEHIVGNSWADEIAGSAQSTLMEQNGVEVDHDEVLTASRKGVKDIIKRFERLAKSTFADLGALGFEPKMSFEGHYFQARWDKGWICNRCGTIAKTRRARVGRFYNLAGQILGVHKSHRLAKCSLEDGSSAIKCPRFGFCTTIRLVKSKECCGGNQRGDGRKLITEEWRPKRKVAVVGIAKVCLFEGVCEFESLPEGGGRDFSKKITSGLLARRRAWKG